MGKGLVKTFLEVKNISYAYSEEIFVDLSFQVNKGEFLTLVGPSGCGKTTLLKILAGLLKPRKGQVLIQGKNIPLLGQVSLMPQGDLLLPWRTVLENGVLPLEIKGVKKEIAFKEVRGLLKEFGLHGYEDYYPSQLSGGMRQRVAFLRSIVSGSDLITLDEPFSALDALTRFKMQKWLLKVWQKHKKTIIFITHDVEEAIFLSQRVFLLSKPPIKKVQEFSIPFSYPRTNNLLGEKNFIELRQKILQGLEGEGDNA